MLEKRKLVLPQAGDDARSEGKADQNESVSVEERTGKPRSEMSDGPKRGESGNYEPARYVLPSGNVCEDR